MTNYGRLPAGMMDHNRLVQHLYAFLTSATDPLSGTATTPSLAPLVDEARSTVEGYRAMLTETKPRSPPPTAERSAFLPRVSLLDSPPPQQAPLTISGVPPMKRKGLLPLASSSVAPPVVEAATAPVDPLNNSEVESACIVTSSTLLTRCHPRNYLLAACRARSPREVVMLLERANAEGSLLASIELGCAFVTGYGCDLSVGLGLEMLDVGVSLGHPGAMWTVARCLKEGTGVPADEELADSWLHRAAEANFAPAQHELGEQYETGEHTDLGLALRWYKKAATLGYPPSQLNLAKMLFTAAQVDLADILAMQPEAVPSLGELSSKARYWLNMAAEGGSTEARQLMDRVGSIAPQTAA